MKTSSKTIFVVCCAAFCLAALLSAHAQVPQLINYQGRVVSGATNYDGTGSFKFAFVNAAGTTTYWSNDGTSVAGSEPTAAVPLLVSKGLFSVLLGNTALPNMTAVPNAVFDHGDVHLRTWFNDGVRGSQMLTPDQRIAAVGYAILAAGVVDGAITSAMIADGAVGTTQMGAAAIQADNIKPGAIGSQHLAAGSVGGAALQQGEIKPEHLAPGAVTSGALAPGAVSSANLQKPPRSGSISAALLDFDFGMADFTKNFDGAFATPPVVTVSISSPPGAGAAAPPVASVWTTTTTVSGFAGRVDIGATARAVDSSGVVGEHPSGALIEDVPAFSFFDRTQSSIKYVRLSNGSQPLTVASSEKDHGFSSLAYVNGGPAIAYHGLDGGDEVLRFLKATDNIGEKWEDPPVTVAYAGFSSGDLVLLVVNGRPAICYHDGDTNTLKFVRATNASGTAWGAPVTLDTPGGGSTKSMAIINGNPAVAYHHATNNDLMFIRATDPSGTAWAAPVIVDVGGAVGRYNSLATVSGNPAISYYDQANGNLNFIRGQDSIGSAWGPSITVDSAGDVGLHTSLVVVEGMPAISYHDQTETELKYVRATTASGIGWGTPVTLDGRGATGLHTSMLISASGEPVIASYDSQGGDLKIIAEGDAVPRPFTINWIALEP